MSELKCLDLFSGIGGFTLGFDCAGIDTVAFCESDSRCQRVLNKVWPHIPCFDDVRELTKDLLDLYGVTPNIICGGFPCQDISDAGLRKGLEGERSGLWFEYLRIIGEIRPKIVVVENVAALRRRGLDIVLKGLASFGYDAEWHCLPASVFGAPHVRDRIWIIAYPRGARREGLVTSDDISAFRQRRWRGKEDLQQIFDAPLQSGDLWPKPIIRRMDDVVSDRAHRLKQVGNAVYVPIAEMLGNIIVREWDSLN